jgi:hopanoid biosynthesis associated protein HpnK
MRRLIVTGDDFGIAVPVNEAIELGHRAGILSAASLMVGASAAADAVARAKRLPELRVGLHLVLVGGRPLLPAAEIPDLVDRHEEFRNGLFAAGVRYCLRPRVRQQLAAEIRAQFAAFQKTGLPLDHVDAHNHLHLHPTVLGLMLKIGREFGLEAVRVPYEPTAGYGRCWQERLAGLALTPWIGLLKMRLHRAGICCNDFVFGMHDTGAMIESTVLRLLAQLPNGVTELYFHPATRRCAELERTMAADRFEQELAALISPAVRRTLDRLGIRPIAYGDLRRE